VIVSAIKWAALTFFKTSQRLVKDDGWVEKLCTCCCWQKTEALAQVSPLPRVSEGRVVDVLHQLGQGLGEEGQVHLAPDVVLRSLQQVQKRLQKRMQLWGRRKVTEGRLDTLSTKDKALGCP